MDEIKEDNTAVMLYIPLGVNTRLDYFQGFGKEELSQCLVGVVFGGIIAIIVYIITKEALFPIITFLGVSFASIVFCQKNSSNISVIDMVKYEIKFNNERKSYPYRQVKEWE